MGIQDEYLRTAIHETIGLYNRTSKSKKLTHLTSKNENRIFKYIQKEDKKYQHDLQETLSKRDYYVNKLNKTLHELVEKHISEEGLDPEGDTEVHTSPEPLSSTFICSRYHAEKFMNGLSSNDTLELASGVSRHMKFQKYYESKRKQLISDPNFNDEQLKVQLEKLDEAVIKKQDELQRDNIALLKKLKIPFFSLEKQWEYPGLEEDKVYILDLIRDRYQR